MICHLNAAGTIELYFYGELTPHDRLAVDRHLQECFECRRALEDLTVIRAALASRPDVATPPGGDWSAFMSMLDRAIGDVSGERAAATATSDSGVDSSSVRVVRMPAGRRLVSYLAVAAVLALVTMTLLTVFDSRGRTGRSGGTTDPRASATRTPEAEPSVDPAMLSVSDQHFERSKLVVLGLVTKDSTSDAANWTYERQLASGLLNDTRLYRLAAEERGMTTLAGVMRDLELVLLQTSMSEQQDPESLEQLQRLIRRRDLITKMNVSYAAEP